MAPEEVEGEVVVVKKLQMFERVLREKQEVEEQMLEVEARKLEVVVAEEEVQMMDYDLVETKAVSVVPEMVHSILVEVVPEVAELAVHLVFSTLEVVEVLYQEQLYSKLVLVLVLEVVSSDLPGDSVQAVQNQPMSVLVEVH